jgi:hypothetical protein
LGAVKSPIIKGGLMFKMGNKINLNVYVTPELFAAIEQRRGLVPRSTFLEAIIKANINNDIKK